ncbi:MAG: hypothetical protein LQ338_005702 [Usnochroma carphineum]|nr:MAG: hypothetical protein LQ338_005702 [Usnochroma carphineum]
MPSSLGFCYSRSSPPTPLALQSTYEHQTDSGGSWRCASPRPYSNKNGSSYSAASNFKTQPDGGELHCSSSPRPYVNGNGASQSILTRPGAETAAERKYPYIPPGPYLTTDNLIFPVLTKDVGDVLRRNDGRVHKKIGEYIFANYEPFYLFPPNDDFGVYLCAAIAKHWSIARHLIHTKVFDPRFSVAYNYACKKWLWALLDLEDDQKGLTDEEKWNLIRLEEKLTVNVLTTYPCLLQKSFQLNRALCTAVQSNLDELMKLAPTKEALQEQLGQVEGAYDYLAKTFIDIRTLPRHFWEGLIMPPSSRGREWQKLMEWRDNIKCQADELAEAIVDKFHFGFRGREQYASWDPRRLPTMAPGEKA